MESNPFATTLCMAIRRPNMTLEQYKKIRDELHAQGLSFLEELFDAIRTAMKKRRHHRYGTDPHRTAER
ncbi:MAG: hypothetical protein PHX87_00920 [Candidatus Peribacteraceae bacterium]|nr:hypothetical protein [Candidatus Peribacteraceae bacterium]MDD5741971.1 hypothetical protein [Candidatus Peribacteraceae bacterium]